MCSPITLRRTTCISRRAGMLEQKNGRLFAVRLHAFVRRFIADKVVKKPWSVPAFSSLFLFFFRRFLLKKDIM